MQHWGVAEAPQESIAVELTDTANQAVTGVNQGSVVPLFQHQSQYQASTPFAHCDLPAWQVLMSNDR